MPTTPRTSHTSDSPTTSDFTTTSDLDTHLDNVLDVARLGARATEALIGSDARHLAAIAHALDTTLATHEARLADARATQARDGRAAVERDQAARRLASRTTQLALLRVDLCLGRFVPSDGGAPVYVGRTGLADENGTRLLVDWRTPAAAPFFAATRAEPLGVASRRRFRWTAGRLSGFWDEILDPAAPTDGLVPDDESQFVASLAGERTDRMRDVLATIQADQDEAIRADARGALVVDGGPGTGKTVVALHRASYLLHADPRIGGVLVLGPSERYLGYVADVLPGLGDEGVATCTLRDLVPEGATAVPEADPVVARLKGSRAMVRAVEAAVRFSEEAPADGIEVETSIGAFTLSADDWADAVDALEPGLPHNLAVDDLVRELALVAARHQEPHAPAAADNLAAAIAHDPAFRRQVRRAWPLLDPAEVVADLWDVPAYLRYCAPRLTADERAALRRDASAAWTFADLPLLDAARALVGEADRASRSDAEREEERRVRAEVAAELRASDDGGEGLMAQLVHPDLADTLLDRDDAVDEASLDGPFAHVVVDEAQDLSDAAWLMVLRRCPSRSVTVVGDRAQARDGFEGTWAERLGRAGLPDVRVQTLTVGYRTPAEVLEEAAPVIRAVLPDADVPTAVRRSGVPVLHAPRTALDEILREWLDASPGGLAAVIGDPSVPDGPRVRSLSAVEAKGLEFDLVVLHDDVLGSGVTGAVDRYVAMTRATSRLVVLHGR